MQGKDRDGNIVSGNEGQEKVISLLYETAPGRQILKLLTMPFVSEAGGKFLDSKLSAAFVKPFIKRNRISMAPFEEETYESYNHFFTRRIKEGERSFAAEQKVLCAPCDSKLSVYPIEPYGRFRIKHTRYTMDSLVCSKRLAKHYYGGMLLVFRLTVDDYHHYAYIDDGEKTRNYHIGGVLHTVNPIAGDIYPIYTENAREFSILKSRNFGRVLMMEVGALMVGKIVNHHEAGMVKRGMEKGFFEFGGSTVILALEKGRIRLDEDIIRNTQEGFETVVRQGEKIGYANR